MLKLSHDSLDQQQQNFQRSQIGQQAQFPNLRQDQLHNQNQIYKNFYKLQLDDLVQQKMEQKRQQKQKQERQRSLYNQRIAHTIEAQKMKDLSYKNYYNLLLNNQSNISKNYISPFDQKNMEKDKLIHQGVEQQKIRGQMLHQQQQRRIEQSKKNYRQYLADQINQKYNKNVVTSSVRERENEQYKKITYTPQQLAKFQRDRRVVEMQRYKQDLDKTNNTGRRQRSVTNANPILKNDFNVHKIEDRHNPMVNPLPYNIQNPYILREMKRKSAFEDEQSNSRYY